MTMTNRFDGRSATATMALVVFLLGGCAGDELDPAADPATTASALAADDGAAANTAIFPLDAHPYGHSLEFWAEEWWRWIYSTPAANNPLLHPGLDSNQNQSGPVFFLAPGDRTNTVPGRLAIAVTPSALLNDYPCPDPTFQPAPGQSLFDFLLGGIAPVNDAVVGVEATLDGRPLNDLLSYRVASRELTSIVGDPSLQTTLDTCITGASQPAVVDAFMFILKPLEPGLHVLTTRVTTAAGQVFDHVQQLDVQ